MISKTSVDCKSGFCSGQAMPNILPLTNHSLIDKISENHRGMLKALIQDGTDP